MKGTKTLLSYLLFIIGLQWKTVYALPQTCQEGEFMCANKRCISRSWKCDEEDDCGDNSDEEKCPKTHRACDESTNFKCYNSKCIPLSWTCDRVDDCGDGSDEDTKDGPFCPKTEECLENYFKCNKSKACIPRIHHCDGINDCGEDDLSDEQNCDKKTCATDEFMCKNGNCISASWKCDNNDDCLDRSDELNCNNQTCSPTQFKCHDSGHCIQGDYRCDGSTDCLDGSDELNCKTTTTLPQTQATVGGTKSVTNPKMTTKTLTTTLAPCQTYEFRCPSNKKCIHKTWLCDGEPDCPKMEDESDAVCSINKCEENQFRCTNGKCIEERDKCDGTNHCSDGLDEKHCPALPITCSDGTYLCKNSTKCIDPSSVCNGIKDCPNGDDEDESCGVKECSENNAGCTHHCIEKKIGYECKCRLGYKLADDKKTCLDINECEQPGMCSQNCINYKGSFGCQCNKGYFLDPVDKKTCRAEAPEPLLVFSNRFDVRQISTNGKAYRSITNTRSSAAIALDVKDEMIYWTDMINKTINRIRKDKTESHEIIIKDGLEKPEGLAVDWIGRKLYWADTGKNTISVSNLDGTHIKTIVNGTESEELRTLAVYPEKGFIFWADWGDQPKMERADLNGKNRKTILDSSEVMWPSSIAIDATLERIFWADMNKRRICSSDIDGKDVREIVTGLTSPYGVTVFEDYVYWTDFHLKKLFKANKFNGLRKATFGSYLSAPMDISVYHPLVQSKVSHPCEDKNGGCSHLCFVTPGQQNKYECACPDFMSLGPDNKKCQSNIPVVSNSTNPAVTKSTPTCEYQCHSSSKCIIAFQKCDGVYDCPEHDDELRCKAEPTVGQTEEPRKSETSKGSPTMKIAVGSSIAGAVVLLVVLAVVLCKRRRSRLDLSMVYETEHDAVRTKGKEDVVGVEIKYVPNSNSKSNKKLRSNKNFDNINFKPVDEAKLPLQMCDMYGDTIVDEYPGSDTGTGDDRDFDDREPIIPHIV